MQRTATLLALFSLLAVGLFAQDRGYGDKQSKNDWEEINFEFNSSILTDGFPSMLRLADVLKAHPDYKVRIIGNTDVIGSNRYNERLGMRRADAVKQFLVKYGANAGQIATESRGKQNPEVGGMTREKLARWVNRRVNMVVTDANGKIIGDGGMNEVLNTAPLKDCCNDILSRLDKLDQILSKLNDLADANGALRRDLNAVRGDVDNLKNQVAGVNTEVQKRPTTPEVTNIVDKEAYEQIRRSRDPRFSLLGLNAGVDDLGRLTFTGKGRYFAPVGKLFGENFAVQAEGEYLYFRDQREGQFDIGLVNRIGDFQAGLFSSFKHVQMRGLDGGTLGQAALTVDYLFRDGKIGLFGTRAFLDNAVVGSRALNQFITQERYLSVVNQYGASFTFGLFGPTYLEGNVGYLESRAHADRPGGTLRFVAPISNRVALTLEGGLNETLLAATSTTRIVAGVQLGNFIKPRDFVGMTGPVPVDVPRIRYELRTRNVTNGYAPPVADAGPDQTVAPGTVTLNGSGSYSPLGLPLTYAWTQVAGPSVTIGSANQAIANFTGAAGQTYSFRLTVTDSQGGQAIARTTVTVTNPTGPQIVQFQATPASINSGGTSVLSYRILNATSATISGIGNVNPQAGTINVNPTQTTTYTLTATNANGTDTATVTVTVTSQSAAILSFSGNPSSVTAGGSSTLTCQTSNSTNTVISGTGVSQSGTGSSTTATVTPTQTTTYTCTATGQNGQKTTATTTVSVNQPGQGQAPTAMLTANPPVITTGQSSTLTWTTTNATTVTISPTVGTTAANGSTQVSPTQTTTYTLTATNASGQKATASVTVTVNAAPANNPNITGFTANPATITVGQSSTLTCVATNANTITITGGGINVTGGTATVSPTQTTTYTCSAAGPSGTQTATASVTVTVNPAQAPALSITNCAVSPATSTGPGAPVNVSYTTTGAQRVNIININQTLPLSGTVVVNPQSTTTYSIVATAANGQTAGCTVSVTVPPATVTGTPPTAIITGPSVIETQYRQFNLDASQSSNPAGGPLTYTWQPVGTGAAILDQGQPTTRVILGGLPGLYVINLTVTNSTGQSATTSVTIRFVNPIPNGG